jgi:hypothetical protein
MTPKSQGWIFLAVGAQAAHSRASAITRSPTGSDLNFRTLWRDFITVVITFILRNGEPGLIKSCESEKSKDFGKESNPSKFFEFQVVRQNPEVRLMPASTLLGFLTPQNREDIEELLQQKEFVILSGQTMPVR